MIAIGLLFVRMLCDLFKPRPRLEAEIVILRHQLNVLQQAHAAPSAAFALGRPRPIHLALSSLPPHSGCNNHRQARAFLTLPPQGFYRLLPMETPLTCA